jgi:uncharacterized protein
MIAQIRFFEIPSSDFNRAIDFYRNVFDFEIEPFDWENEKMAMISGEPVGGCIFHSEGFMPSKDGVIISFEVDDIETILVKAVNNGGKIVMEKCKIQSDNLGYCGYFIDCEGNRIGLYSK